MGLKSYKKMYLIGDVDYDSYATFSEELDKLDKKPPGVVPIELSSIGGDAYVALAFYDKIISSKHEIHITVRGLVASAAILILTAGTKRVGTSSSWFMVHEDEPVVNEGARVTEIERDARHARRLEHQWNYLLEERTGVSSKIWANLHKEETYLSAHEAKKLKLLTDIV